MADIRIRPFQLDDMLRIELREIDSRFGTDMEMGVRSTVALAERGEAVTLYIEDGPIVAIAGITAVFSGVGEMWGLSGKAVDKYPVAFYKITRKLFAYWEANNNLHRLQCKIATENVRSQGWVKRLGFNFEGTMRKYDAHGRDYQLYARVR